MPMRYTPEDVAEAIYPHWPKAEGGVVNRRNCWPQCDVGEGWSDVLIYAIRIGEDHDKHFVVHQVKEKFGGLRFYSNLPARYETMIEGMASHICEECGEYGVLSMTKGRSPWYKTLCQEHRGDKYLDKWSYERFRYEEAES